MTRRWMTRAEQAAVPVERAPGAAVSGATVFSADPDPEASEEARQQAIRRGRHRQDNRRQKRRRLEARAAAVAPAPFAVLVSDRPVEPEDPPADLPAAERLLRALLAGQPPGTLGRVDALAYPGRRGAHAYTVACELVVAPDGTLRPLVARLGATAT